MSKATIWIARENEEFWINLENKSGWVNAVIDALLEEELVRKSIYKKHNNGDKDEEDETTVLQDTQTETKG
jgi:hypothetical protein